jgi:hypothetical protein
VALKEKKLKDKRWLTHQRGSEYLGLGNREIISTEKKKLDGGGDKDITNQHQV